MTWVPMLIRCRLGRRMNCSQYFVLNRVLIIDDSRIIRALLAEVLSEAGFGVETASNGTEGLQLADPARFSALLCDLSMPGISGFEVVETLKARHPILPVVIITDSSDLASAVQAMQRGAFSYLTKGTTDHALVDELRKAIAHRHVLERNSQLERELHAHDQKLAAIGARVAAVAHEINNPLAILKANTRFVLETLPSLAGSETADGQDVTQAMGEVETCTQRIFRVVADLQRVVHKKPGPSSCEVEAALEDCQLICRARLPAGLHLQFETGQTPALQISQDDLVSIISNLVINAAHAVEGLGKAAQVKVRTWEHGGQVTVEVRDNGCGIPAENLANVFQPFFTTKPAGKGTGLGLSLVQQLVQAAGGALTIDSTVGRGTSVRINLPVVKTGAASEPAAAS